MPETAHLAAALGDRYRIERELGAGGMTHDLRRGVGIVERRSSDVFLVRNFDPRRRRN